MNSPVSHGKATALISAKVSNGGEARTSGSRSSHFCSMPMVAGPTGVSRPAQAAKPTFETAACSPPLLHRWVASGCPLASLKLPQACPPAVSWAPKRPWVASMNPLNDAEPLTAPRSSVVDPSYDA
ncbi:unannotated protein [freshwater metagenome]|uniref:Unannotated protein n=1 Tax=freshwater metagenome TaxID=449393 RepID=A0A6J6QS07_9ZZZZ